MLRGPITSRQVAPAPLAHSGVRHAEPAAPTAAAELRCQLTTQCTRLHAAVKGKPRARVTWRQALRALNHWRSWALVVTLVASQFTCIFWSSQTSKQYMIYGQDPTNGASRIDGFNDEPYSDRSLVCMRQGRLYRPMQLSAVLASARAEIVDTTGQSASGYRVVSRQEIGLEDLVAERYAPVQPDDDLRIVHGVSSAVTTRLVNSLPVLIMPYWDNAIFTRYAVPGLDGSACMPHLGGLYDSADALSAGLSAINRTVRESRTAQWLGLRASDGAEWRNRWLEDPTTGQRWYADLASSVAPADDKYGIRERQFDVLANREFNCAAEPQWCHATDLREWWGNQFYSTDTELWVNSLVVSNGSRYGLFLYEAMHRSTIYSVYDVATLISNTTVALMLFRWFVASIVLLNAYRRGYSHSFSTPGIGCLSCTRNFELLPLLLLPRMTNALAAFFTAGCKFEAEQRAISDAWFVIYPALAEVMPYYFSLLNLLAKVLHRRLSDDLFGPSLAFLCLLHWLRLPLALSGLFEFDGRISTVMTASEYEKLRLIDFFTTDAALRLNGNVWSIFGVKLVVLATSLLPFAFAQKMNAPPWEGTAHNVASLTAIECALGVGAAESSGLGVSQLYSGQKVRTTDNDSGQQRRLDCYELVRLGYIVFGDVVTDWLTLVLLALMRWRERESNYPVLGFRLVLAAPSHHHSTTRPAAPRGRWKADCPRSIRPTIRCWWTPKCGTLRRSRWRER